MLSGEGPTDIGATHPGTYGNEFVPGPMAKIVDRLIGVRLHYSILDSRHHDPDAIRHVSKSELSALKDAASTVLPGWRTGKGKGFGYYARSAELLGRLAVADRKSLMRPTIAVLFHDGDGTNSSSRDEWQQKLDSMLNGFGWKTMTAV